MHLSPAAARRWSAVFALALVAGTRTPVWSQVAPPAPVAAAVQDVGAHLWAASLTGDGEGFDLALARLAMDGPASLREPAATLREHLAQRESTRSAKMLEVRGELEKNLAEPETDLTLSKCLRSALELHVLTPDRSKEALLREAAVQDLMRRGEAAARAAEDRGDVLTSGELFVLLDLLNDVKGTYKRDVRRLSLRQELLRTYVPQRLWELRDARQKAAGEKPLPPYNAFGNDWRQKLASIDESLVQRCVWYAERHVTEPKMPDLLRGGLEAVRTFVTTRDLASTFEGLRDEQGVASMLAFIDQQEADLARASGVDRALAGRVIDRLMRHNDKTIRVAKAALLHEFGNGVTSTLDEFSEFIWPDEVRRFQKSTQGHFIGVGIQIEYDELQNVRVVSPIEGTPAQRAGVKPLDIITKVDGNPIFGLSLDQAVDVITGPEGTTVKLTVERVGEGAPADAPKQEVTFNLRRSRINVATVKGWRRQGAREDQWDWFIDPTAKIGYVRLHQFADKTTDELDRAAAEMKSSGLNGLVLDLRFNPGGLLDQAVKVARRFVDKDNARIVSTQGQGGQLESSEFSDPASATLGGIPVVVLINEGSASASEIVSGCLLANAKSRGLDVVVLGARSYGKGSVQNVWPVPPESMVKITTGYYQLPDGSVIHRRPGSESWGVDPNLRIEMLPEQTREAILTRRNADVLPLDEHGVAPAAAPADPRDVLTKGTDLQLEAALLLLRARAGAGDGALARSEK